MFILSAIFVRKNWYSICCTSCTAAAGPAEQRVITQWVVLLGDVIQQVVALATSCRQRDVEQRVVVSPLSMVSRNYRVDLLCGWRSSMTNQRRCNHHNKTLIQLVPAVIAAAIVHWLLALKYCSCRSWGHRQQAILAESGNRQHKCSEDYMEASLMLQYNMRWPL